MENLQLLGRIEELEKRIEKLESKKKSKPADSGVSQTRSAFIESYKSQFGHDYYWGAKESGMAKNWLKSIPVARAEWLIKWYVLWKDPFIVKKGHPFNLLVGNTVQLEAILARGKKYFTDVAESELIQRETVGRETEKVEVMHHATRAEQKRTNNRIGFGDGGKLQGIEAPTSVPGEGNGNPGGAV